MSHMISTGFHFRTRHSGQSQLCDWTRIDSEPCDWWSWTRLHQATWLSHFSRLRISVSFSGVSEAVLWRLLLCLGICVNLKQMKEKDTDHEDLFKKLFTTDMTCSLLSGRYRPTGRAFDLKLKYETVSEIYMWLARFIKLNIRGTSQVQTRMNFYAIYNGFEKTSWFHSAIFLQVKLL